MNISGSDYVTAFDFLLAYRTEDTPTLPTVDGKKLHNLQDLLKVFSANNEPLSAEHQAAVDRIFIAPQSGYHRTAWNLFHRIRTKESARRRRDTMKRLHAAA